MLRLAFLSLTALAGWTTAAAPSVRVGPLLPAPTEPAPLPKIAPVSSPVQSSPAASVSHVIHIPGFNYNLNSTNGTCTGCNLQAAKITTLSFPYPIESITSTVSVVPHITVYRNGTNMTITNYETVTANATVTVGGDGHGKNASAIPTGTDHLTWTWSGVTLTYPTTYIAYPPKNIFGGLQTPWVLGNGKERTTICKDNEADLPTEMPMSSFVIPLTGSINVPQPSGTPQEGDDPIPDLPNIYRRDDLAAPNVYQNRHVPSKIIDYLSTEPTYSAVFAGHDMHTCTFGTFAVPYVYHTAPPPPPGGYNAKSTVLVLQTNTGSPVYNTVNGPAPVAPQMATPMAAGNGGGNGGGAKGYAQGPSNGGSGTGGSGTGGSGAGGAGSGGAGPGGAGPGGAGSGGAGSGGSSGGSTGGGLGGVIANVVSSPQGQAAAQGGQGSKGGGYTSGSGGQGSSTGNNGGNGGLGGVIANAVGSGGAQGGYGGSPAGPSAAGITPPPAFPPSINVGGQVVTANAQGSFVIGPGTTLAPGGPATVIGGSTISIGFSPSGSTYAVINGQTSYLSSTTGAAYLYGPGTLTINGQTYAPTVSNGKTWYVVGGTTLTPGGVATIAGTTLSLDASDNTLVINGQTSSVRSGITGVTGTPTGVQMFTGSASKSRMSVAGVAVAVVAMGFAML